MAENAKVEYLIKMLLELFIGKVNAKLFKTDGKRLRVSSETLEREIIMEEFNESLPVSFETFKTINIKNTN